MGSTKTQLSDSPDCVLIGGSRGIGLATSIKLVKAQKRILFTSSNPKTGAAAAEAIFKATKTVVPFLSGDLSSLTEVDTLAERIAAECPAMNTLILCAGIACTDYQQTVDRIERTFAVNHLAGFRLVDRLLDLLKSNAPSNIVVVASQIHAGGFHEEFEPKENGYNGYRAYEESKLANVLFTYELDRRLKGTNVRVNCLHPGVVQTTLIENLYAAKPAASGSKPPQSGAGEPVSFARRVIKAIKWRARKLLGKSSGLDTPETAASRIAQLVLDDSLANVSGQYFHSGEVADSKFATYDEKLAKRLWIESEKLIQRSLSN